MTASERRGWELGTLLADSPAGMTINEMCRTLNWNPATTRRAIRALRLVLGDADTINVVCEPTEHRQQWAYRLVGHLNEAQWYTSNRIDDLEARVVTQSAIARSIEAGTDGRTNDGKRARILARGLTRILEDIEELNHQ